jgi:hypothetical protein
MYLASLLEYKVIGAQAPCWLIVNSQGAQVWFGKPEPDLPNLFSIWGRSGSGFGKFLKEPD